MCSVYSYVVILTSAWSGKELRQKPSVDHSCSSPDSLTDCNQQYKHKHYSHLNWPKLHMQTRDTVILEQHSNFTTQMFLSDCNKAAATKLPLRTSRTFTIFSDRVGFNIYICPYRRIRSLLYHICHMVLFDGISCGLMYTKSHYSTFSTHHIGRQK